MALNSKNNTKENSIEETVLQGVLQVVENTTWTGTMTQLNTKLKKTLGNKTALPGSPSALRIVLNRVVNRLRSRGISVKFLRANTSDRTRFVKLVG